MVEFIQVHAMFFTICALMFAFVGTVLLAWDYLQWSNIKKAKFDQEYGIIVAITENIWKQKWGSMLIGFSIIIQLTVELSKRLP
jgi:hypothetical protein